MATPASQVPPRYLPDASQMAPGCLPDDSPDNAMFKILTKLGTNGYAMSPHGLIFDEDGAISCPMPLDAFPTPFGVIFRSF